jgi:hypothetical protein
LPVYINNSDKAVRKPLIVFDVLTGEEKAFESVANAVRCYNPNAVNFDSDCATLSHCANKGGYYLNRYLAKRNPEDSYVLTSRNTQIYNSVYSRFYKDANDASTDMGISVWLIKKACKEESNNKWLYVNQCARVKLRESGKIFR